MALRVPRSVVLYMAGATLVRLADEGARVALVFLAVEKGSGAGEGGLLTAAFLVPHVIAAPMLGNLIDRAKAPMQVVALGIMLAALSLIAAALLIGHAPAALVAAILFAGGCGGPAITGGLSSQLTSFVEADEVPRAFGFDGLTYNVAGIVGPALAAAIVAIASATIATLSLAALAVIGSLTLMALRGKAQRAAPANPTSLLGGLHAIAANRALWATTLANAITAIGMGALPVVLVATLAATSEPERAGWLLSVMAIGAVAGSFLWIGRPASVARAPLVIAASSVLTGLSVASLAPIGPASSWAVASFALAGAGSAVAIGATFLIRDAGSPDEARAQVFSLAAGAKVTAGAQGAALGGTLFSLPAPMLWVAAAPLIAGLTLVPLIGGRPSRS